MAMDFTQFEDLRRRMALTPQQIKDIEVACAKDLAARLLRSAVKNTPTGVYPKESGKQGGTLKRAWSIKVPKLTANGCTLDVINPTEYASYVEYGHRQEPGRFVPALGKRLKASWVNGRFMLTKAEDELRPKAQAIVDKKTMKIMEEVLNGK